VFVLGLFPLREKAMNERQPCHKWEYIEEIKRLKAELKETE
jgi:hypothetical protein